MFRKIPWFFAFLTFLLMIKLSGPVKQLINLPAFIMVFFAPVLLLMSIYKPGDISKALKIFFAPADAGIPVNEIRYSSSLISTYGIMAMATGILCSLMGIIAILANLAEPGEVLMNISISMLTMLYGIVAYLFICLPATFYLKGMAERNAYLKDLEQETD